MRDVPQHKLQINVPVTLHFRFPFRELQTVHFAIDVYFLVVMFRDLCNFSKNFQAFAVQDTQVYTIPQADLCKQNLLNQISFFKCRFTRFQATIFLSPHQYIAPALLALSDGNLYFVLHPDFESECDGRRVAVYPLVQNSQKIVVIGVIIFPLSGSYPKISDN